MSSKQLIELRQELKKYVRQDKKNILAKFFKTKPGEYGAGDLFLGVMVPQIRQVARKYHNLPWLQVRELQRSAWHEERLCALLIMVNQYQASDLAIRKIIFRHYLSSTKYINNWDLVDLSAPNILGDYLLNKNKKILLKLVKSNNLWERRIAIISTYTFIRHNQFNETLKLARKLLKDDHDLIHKAVGWMLREVGNKDQKVEKSFLNKYYQVMPRTMLRYAIEKFNKKQRSFYMKK